MSCKSEMAELLKTFANNNKMAESLTTDIMNDLLCIRYGKLDKHCRYRVDRRVISNIGYNVDKIIALNKLNQNLVNDLYDLVLSDLINNESSDEPIPNTFEPEKTDSDESYIVQDVSGFSNKQLVDYLYTIIKQKYQIRIVFIAPNSIDEEGWPIGHTCSTVSFEPCSEDSSSNELMSKELVIYQHVEGCDHSEVKEYHLSISHMPGSFMFSMSTPTVKKGILCYAAVPIELADSLFDLIQCEYDDEPIIIDERIYKKIKSGRDISAGIYVLNILEKLIEISPFVLGHIDWKKLRFVGPEWVDPNQTKSNGDDDVSGSILEEIKEKFDPFICFYATTNETELNDTLCCIMDKCEIIDPNPHNQNSSKDISMVTFTVQDPEEDLGYKVNFITHTALASLCSVPRCGVSIMAVPVINVFDVDEFSKLYDYPNPRFLCAKGRFNMIPLADNSCSLHVMIGEPVKLVCNVIDKTNMLIDNRYIDIMEEALKDIKRKEED